MGIFGNNTGLWSYHIHLLPIYPNPFQDDFTVTALTMMVVFQFCYSWKKFLIWAGVVSGTLSFILFPIFIKFGILKLYNWSLFYSFVLIFWIATFSRWVLLEVLNIEKRTRNTNDEREHLNKQPKWNLLTSSHWHTQPPYSRMWNTGVVCVVILHFSRLRIIMWLSLLFLFLHLKNERVTF